MAKSQTLQRIDEEIAAGKLGIARDRLQGLIAAYPEDLSLRTRLGEVYFKLGYPVLAGQFWFLEESLTEEQRGAVNRFVKDCNGDALTILKRLRLRIPSEAVREKAVREKLNALEDECLGKGQEPPAHPFSVAATQTQDRAMLIGCSLVGFFLVAVFVVGMVTVLGWIERLYAR